MVPDALAAAVLEPPDGGGAHGHAVGLALVLGHALGQEGDRAVHRHQRGRRRLGGASLLLFGLKKGEQFKTVFKIGGKRKCTGSYCRIQSI